MSTTCGPGPVYAAGVVTIGATVFQAISLQGLPLVGMI